MASENYRTLQRGICTILNSSTGAMVQGLYEIEEITSGDAKTTMAFWGYQMTVRFGEEERQCRYEGNTASWSPLLNTCYALLASEGLHLLVAGKAPGYTETRLSVQARYGHLPSTTRAVPIMSYAQFSPATGGMAGGKEGNTNEEDVQAERSKEDRTKEDRTKK